MPHSSGGGSHGGGFHGGSHGGSHGGHSSGPRVSRRPFRNSRRFMYYNRYGTARYIYSTAMPRRQTMVELVMNVFITGIMAVVGLVMMGSAFRQIGPPKPLKPQYIENSIHIEDKIGIIDEQAKLEETLNLFEDKTGICPYIMTVYDSDWDENYVSLEKYAYSLYVNKFDDEQHFLIVCSEPENSGNSDFIDWSWEGMQGDDTDRIITENNFNKFGNELQKYMTKDSVSLSQALEISFKHSLDYIMSGNKDIEAYTPVFMAGVWVIIILFALVRVVVSYKASQRDYQEVGMDDYSDNNFYQQ